MNKHQDYFIDQRNKQKLAALESKRAKLFTASHLAALRKYYGGLNQVDPCGPAFEKLRSEVAAMTPELLLQLAAADIKWLGYLAKQELAKRAAAVDKLAEQYPGLPCTLEP